MNALLNLYLRMWVLRANPQDLPASRSLVYLLAAVYVLVSMVSVLELTSIFGAFAASILDLGLMVLTVNLLLAIAKVPERGIQTLSAVFGTSVLLVIVSTVLLALLESGGMRGSMLLLLVAWYLLIFGHILRQAIGMPVLLGSLIGLAYLMLSAGITSSLFFPSAGEGG